ncbi:WD40 repeat domain-containing protein [Veronia pacifica]|uniref:Uncharacterized protein n=1 Tax=Veronia pacifica TaxID=1080227 RepID=A0A1C3EPN4_9GAMM|nr:WD40 repeat domain-containing protein [Veronia pacifica]ODA35176.1 hypothetical protein A8L45_04480 [Veronia pacifica]
MRKYVCALIIVLLAGCGNDEGIKSVNRIQLTDSPVEQALLSADGNLTALVTSSQNIQVWENTLKAKVLDIASGTFRGQIVSLLISEDNSTLVAANARQVFFWDIATGEKLAEHILSGIHPMAKIRGLAISMKSQSLIAGFSDGSVTAMNLSSGNTKTLTVHNKSVNHLYFSPDGVSVITAADDGLVKHWLLANGKVQEQYKFDHSISSLAVDRSFERFFASGVMKKQRIIHLDASKAPSNLSYSKRFKWFKKAIFVEGAPILITASSKSEITGWNENKGKEVMSWKITDSDDEVRILDIEMSDSNHLYSISTEGVLESWDVKPLVTASLQ